MFGPMTKFDQQRAHPFASLHHHLIPHIKAKMAFTIQDMLPVLLILDVCRLHPRKKGNPTVIVR